MSLSFMVLEPNEQTPRIVVFGVGGAGGNAVDNMIAQALEGVEFVAANTDAQALQQSKSSIRLQLGAAVTRGLGAGANPSIGARAAEESAAEVRALLEGASMCFVTAGMGGGTGTGAAPVIARIAREAGVLTIGVVTKPFAFEGPKRMRLAEAGLLELERHVDTLIVIPNQHLFKIANERTTFAQAFVMADNVLYQGVKGVTDLMVRPGLVNLDFADVRAVMDEMGKAMMGSGEGEGDGRALAAAERAIDNPLLDEVSLAGARGVLINITAGPDLKLFEVDEVVNRIRKEVDGEASIFFGSALDPSLEGRIRVAVVATGIDAEAMRRRNAAAAEAAAAGVPSEAARIERAAEVSVAADDERAPASTLDRAALDPVVVEEIVAEAAPIRVDTVETRSVETRSVETGAIETISVAGISIEAPRADDAETARAATRTPRFDALRAEEARREEARREEFRREDVRREELRREHADPRSARAEAAPEIDSLRVEIPSFLRRHAG